MAKEHLAETIQRLHELVEPIVAREGFELVDLTYNRAGKRYLLRVTLDRAGRTSFSPDEGEDPGTVGIDDCVRVSRTLSPILDAEDVVPGAYTLEVSSPGLDRPLKTPRHFEMAAGMTIRVKTRVPIDGAEFFIAPLVAADDEEIRLDVRGTEVTIPYRLIARANLEPDL